MKEYPISMVPGPVEVYPSILDCYKTNFGSGDLETDFFDLYLQTEIQLQKMAFTKNKFAIQTGEGMLALWSALKSCILPGDKVLSIATGLFGYGIGSMAKSIGANVRIVGLNSNETIQDLQEIEKAIIEHKPKMITIVHCETPSGTLNPLGPLCELKKALGVPLIYVEPFQVLGEPQYTRIN